MSTDLKTFAAPAPLELARKTALVVGGTVLIALAAQIKVPMWPVPMTFQTLAVLLIGLTYGGRAATATLTLYIAEGAMGLPVFTNGGGIAQIVGPTGGYLFGFLMAAATLGFASDRGWTRSVPALLGLLVLATALIYLPGVLWLAGFVGLQKAVSVGMMPFLPGDAAKAGLAALLAIPGRRLMGRN